MPRPGRTRNLENVRLAGKDCAAAVHSAAEGTVLPRASRPRTDDIGRVAQSLVSRVYEEVLHESCVIFVGSGCTTEGRRRDWGTFYDEIKERSGYPSSAAPT